LEGGKLKKWKLGLFAVSDGNQSSFSACGAGILFSSLHTESIATTMGAFCNVAF